MKLTETGGLIDMAKEADKAKTDEEMKKIREGIAELKSKAKYKTIDEAIKNQGKK